MSSAKKICMGLILALLFLHIIILTPRFIYSTELTNQEKALNFLSDVVGLDLAKYHVELKSNDVLADGDVRYYLVCEGSQVTTQFFFEGNTKLSYRMMDSRDPILCTQSATDRIDAAKGFMERYQTFTGGAYLTPLKEMLENITELKNTIVTVNDLRLKVEPSPVGEDYVTFQWMYTPNGIHNRFTRITLMLNNGVLEQFSDNWNNCVVGSSEVNISNEQAISLAKEHVAAYSYMFGNRSINNLTVNEDISPQASLSMQVRTGNLLYPRWELLVPLDDFYPGFVTGIRVYLWADTAELELIQTSSVGGGGAPETSNDVP
jgi:hypothetical protein